MSTATKTAAKTEPEVEITALDAEGTSVLVIDEGAKEPKKYQIKFYRLGDALPSLESQYGAKFYLARDVEHARAAAEARVRLLMEENVPEFMALLGDEAHLIRWAQGESTHILGRQFDSLDEWLRSWGEGEAYADMFLWEDYTLSPVLRITDDLVAQLEFTPTIALRWD